MLKDIYKTSLSLLTDFYELSMAYGFWKSGKKDLESVFSLNFRSNPFNGGYTIAAGLQYVIEYLQDFTFHADDLNYLAGLTDDNNRPLFEDDFLQYLADIRFECDVEAIPEGTIVFPYEPLVRVHGPIIQCQLIETPLLNLINFQSLIATKSSRVVQAAGDEPVLEFGLRRAHGIDGGLAVSRAAYIGGCSATSNVLAGRLFDIPVRGTHAHSWIMTFESEQEAFDVYGDVLPDNSVFLVDTYNTLEGVKKAIETGKRLKKRGYKLMGIRLDSGDLAYLSIQARHMLDEAGFNDSRIYASNDLDENIIQSLKAQGARITVWGVGTKLATAYDQPALGGVYKLNALKKEKGQWEYKIKLSEQSVKISNPGMLQVRRYKKHDEYAGDAIFDEISGIGEQSVIVDPFDITRRKKFDSSFEYEDLLKPVFRGGKCVYTVPDIHSVRQHARQQLKHFHKGIKRFVNPHQYPVGLEENLHKLKTRLVLRARGFNDTKNGG